MKSTSAKTRLCEIELEVNPALGVTTVVRVKETDGTQSVVRISDLKGGPVKEDAFKAFEEFKARCKKEAP